jgi:hypothetical protein
VAFRFSKVFQVSVQDGPQIESAIEIRFLFCNMIDDVESIEEFSGGLDFGQVKDRTGGIEVRADLIIGFARVNSSWLSDSQWYPSAALHSAALSTS